MLESMALTSTDLDAINAAIASGELSVQFRDRSVTYRSMDDLVKAKRAIQQEIASTSTTALKPRYQRAVFGD